MRAGIVGQIYAYPNAGGVESVGQGIDIDAKAESHRATVRFVPERGPVQWFEAGEVIDEPDWFGDAE